jgi:cytoskeleton protein RodZ
VRLLVLAAVLAACTATYALYEQWNAVRDFVASKLSPPPAAPVPAAQPPVPVAQTPAPAPAPEVAPPAAAEETPPAAQPEQQPAAAAPAPAPPVAGATEFGQGAVAVKLSAQDIVWVDVTASGKRLYQDVMRPGAALTFRGAAVRIRLGNAGGVSVTWNGKDVPPLGPKGQVRTVLFGETSYEIIPPAKPATATPPAPPDSAGPAE